MVGPILTGFGIWESLVGLLVGKIGVYGISGLDGLAWKGTLVRRICTRFLEINLPSSVSTTYDLSLRLSTLYLLLFLKVWLPAVILQVRDITNSRHFIVGELILCVRVFPPQKGIYPKFGVKSDCMRLPLRIY